MSAALHLPEARPDREGDAAFVLSLRARGINDLHLLRAMETVPRELFAPRRYADLARSDVALPLPCGETMTAPGTVAAMLAALAVRPGQRVLEIGTGSGYVTALLARMGATVRSVERHRTLAESAGSRLGAAGAGADVALAFGDAFAERDEGARFDRILLNGAVPGLGGALTSRLAAGGRLVCAVADGTGARLLVVSRGSDGRIASGLGGPLRIARLGAAAMLSAAALSETEA